MKQHLVILTTALIVGCSQPQPTSSTLPTSATQTESSDQQIAAQVRRALDLADPQVAGAITIEVANGVVSLRGVSPDIRAAWRAVAAAQSVAGVKQVNNHLLFSSP